jgi:hypothetical protein
MPGTARVLLAATRRTSASVDDLSRHGEEYWMSLADLMRWFVVGRRAVDETNSRLLRSYQLRNTQPLWNGGFGRTPIGVVVGDADYASFHKGSRTRFRPKPPFLGTRAADSSYLGYFRLLLPNGVDLDDHYLKWLNSEPHYKPQAEWTLSPFGPAALKGRPPVLITVHHKVHDGFGTQIMTKPQRAIFGRTLPETEYRKEFVDAEDLVGLLRQDRYLQSALAAHPDSDIWLNSCSVGQHEAQVIANAFKRTTHFSTGDTMNFRSGRLLEAVIDSSSLPFSVTDHVLLDFNSSLRSAPPELRDVGEKYGWSALAAWGDADSSVPPIQTVAPK